MVFENLVVYLLDKYLRDYIDNLDTKKLKIDLWNGNVVLENLYLKPNALANFNLPVTISIGYLQKLTLQVPWKNLYAHPTKASVDGLYLVVVPSTEIQYDAQRDEEEQHDAKMKEVRKIEHIQKEMEAESSGKGNENLNDTFLERMQLLIIQNLELSIRNIHIVYEDKTTKPSHPFSFGITLNYITLHTTTADWKPTILKENTSLIHKLGELSSFSIYWNTDVTPRSDLSRDEAIKDLKAKIAVNSQQIPSNISYILRPLNVTAKLILTMKPRQENFKRPMFDIKIDLDEISLNLNRDQYSDMLDLLDIQDYLQLQSKYIKYRMVSDQNHDKPYFRYWKFAYEAIVNEEVRPRFDCYKWKNIRAHLDRRREYRSIHLQELTTGNLTHEQKQRAQELEKKLDAFNLIYVRRSAEIEAKKRKKQEPQSWWGTVSNWWGGAKPHDDPDLDLEKMMSPEEKNKLYEAIGYAGEDTSTSSYPEEYVDIDLVIRLNMLNVNVWSKVNENDTEFRVILRAVIPDTGVIFNRRPTKNAIALFVDLGSFQVYGISNDFQQSELSNSSRPVLSKPSLSSNPTQQKLLQIEFETSPLNQKSDYRVKIVSQSLEIVYHSPTINKLVECFEPGTKRHLYGVKQAAYSTYTDVKNRSYILMKHNIEKIKVLDIDIDLQSSYFLLPENGVYQNGAAALCMDFGHLTLKRALNQDMINEKSTISEGIDDVRERSFTQFKLKLEDIQLIYAHQNESWENARKEKNSRLHLIKPMEVEMNVDKCIYTDDAVLPAWKVSGNVPGIELHLSDKRLFQIINHMKLIPYPESKHPIDDKSPSIEPEPIISQTLLDYSEEAYEAIEGMTQKQQNLSDDEDNDNAQMKKNVSIQSTQLKAMFTLENIDLYIDEALNSTNENDHGHPFLRLTLESIIATAEIKTFDMEFNASLANLIVYHEQFIDKGNQQLRLLSAQLDRDTNDDRNVRTLASISFLHTSPLNPLFKSSDYNGIENRAYIHFTKLVVTLQLEALLSILRFQDGLLKRLPQSPTDDEIQKQHIEEKEQIAKIQKEKRMLLQVASSSGKVVRNNEVQITPTLKVEALLEEFRVIISSKLTHLFDIQVQGVKGHVSQATESTSINLILTDLCILDPHENARYRKIISQLGNEKELLRVDLSLFNYPQFYLKPIDAVDCDVKVHFAKANIIFLFKHIDAILGFLDSLNITKAAIDLASSQADAAYEQVQKLQEEAFKVQLDITFNAPNIIIPTNSYSDEALLFDLGRLTLKTKFDDDPKCSLVEQQNIRLEDVLASRVKLDQDYSILGEVILLECAELNTVINRLLYPEKNKTQPGVSIKIEWDLVHFRLAKDDYACVMKVLMGNFVENIRDQISATSQLEQYHYREEAKEQEENALRDAVIKKQLDAHGSEILETIRIRAEIKKVALTLYLGQSDLRVRREPRNEKLKLANVEITTLEALFRQNSNASYKVMARMKNLLLDDLRETDKPTSVTRMIDRHFTVDRNKHMLVMAFEFHPRNSSNTFTCRKLSAQLESLYICISLDYLMTLQDFLISGLPTPTENANTDKAPLTQKPSKTVIPSNPALSALDHELETLVDIIVKNPEIILLENQHNANSNCLVLDLAMQMRIINVGDDSKSYIWLKDLTVYSSNFAALQDSKGESSKIKYRILQPAKADIIMIFDREQQKIDVRISDIMVSIAPAAVRTLIAVTNSLGKVQTKANEEVEKVNSKSLFKPKPCKDGNFWFIKDFNESESESSIAKVSEQHIQKPIAQQLILALETIEIKLEVGLGSSTKSVIAVCLSNLTADVKNWSSDLHLSSTVNIEAALFNEHMLAWEPLIEPILDTSGSVLLPWCLTCSILPMKDEQEEVQEAMSSWAENFKLVSNKDASLSTNPKQTIYIRAEQLLNITLTKTGLDLLQRLSALFNDVYNERLPSIDDDKQPMLSLRNATGKEININNLDGLEFADNKMLTSMDLNHDQSIVLDIPNERQSGKRLSVIEDQDFKRRQEFIIKIDNIVKIISINRTWKRIYDLGPSVSPNQSIQMLCDTQLQNDRRYVILSSIVKIYNQTNSPIILINVDSLDTKKHVRLAKIDVNTEYYVPINVLYANSHSSLTFAVHENDDDDDDEEIKDFFSFDWDKEFGSERKIKLKDGKDAYFIIFKEVIEAYTENTDQLDRSSFNIYIHPAMYLTNLLPIDIECSIDNIEQVQLKPSQLHLITSGGKHSTLIITIPSYNNSKWVSEPIHLQNQGKGDNNEYVVKLHNAESANSQTFIRLILRVDSYHSSHRLLLYSPFWILNRTELKLEFRIENSITFIDTFQTPFFICPESLTGEGNKKAQIRLCSIENKNGVTDWSEKFSLDVIKTTGMASCKAENGRTYTICVDIAACSFGLTKTVTFSPSIVLINNLTVDIEFVETVSDIEQDKWSALRSSEIIPFWPHNIKEGVMRVRYMKNRVTSRPFMIHEKHRTLLRMDDEECPAIYVEVTATDFDGVRIIFEDYKIGDAPVLVVNYLKNDAISFSQDHDITTQVLPAQSYVYYTWFDPLKPRELVVSCGRKTEKIGLHPICNFFGQDDDYDISYAVFVDGVQTVLLISDNPKMIEAAFGLSALPETTNQSVQIGIQDIGLSLVNDISRTEILYMSLTKSKIIWTEKGKSRVRALPNEVNSHLEELYKTHMQRWEINPNDESALQKKYKMDEFRYVTFQGNEAILADSKGQTKSAKRQALDGLWIEYSWSNKSSALHLRINRAQIDNQLDYTMFPVALYPIMPKGVDSDIVEKPFIELSIYESKTTRSNVMQIKYFKLLVQEFVVKIDQGLIISILGFLRQENNATTFAIDMNADLEQIQKPLSAILKAQTDSPSGETEMYFDNIHLSPLKIHISFSMHGSKSADELLAEYPLVAFLLKTLNVAEVQDVILRLGYYERNHDRYTITKLTNEVSSHYQNQLMKQIHVLVFGLDVLGNPFGVIRGLAEGVESFFYEPYKGAIEGPIEFAEGVATGVRTLFGSAVGGAAGAFSKIAGVLGKGLATLTFDEDYKLSRTKRKELSTNATTNIAVGGKNVVMGFVDGVKGVVTKPVSGAKEGGASGFVKGLGKGFLGLVTRPTGGFVDFASTSLDLIKRSAQQEEIIRRIRYPRHVGRDGLVRPYVAHDAMGFFLLNRVASGKYSNTDTYVAHITCAENPPSWLLATSKRLLFITEISFLGSYEMDWEIDYDEMKEEPVIKPNLGQIQIVVKEPKKIGKLTPSLSYGKMVTYRNIIEARYIVEKVTNAMHAVGL